MLKKNKALKGLRKETVGPGDSHFNDPYALNASHQDVSTSTLLEDMQGNSGRRESKEIDLEALPRLR